MKRNKIAQKGHCNFDFFYEFLFVDLVFNKKKISLDIP